MNNEMFCIKFCKNDIFNCILVLYGLSKHFPGFQGCNENRNCWNIKENNKLITAILVEFKEEKAEY